jgi:osmoprotectant transport system permease protein
MSTTSLADRRPGAPSAFCDRVALFLGLVCVAAAAFGGFISVAPNRLADGQPLPLWHLGTAPAVIVYAWVALFFLAAFLDARWRAGALSAAGAGLLISVLLIAGVTADRHLDPQEPARRISLGSAFWILFAVALLACFQALQNTRSSVRFALWVALVIAAVAPVALGKLDALSLVREFHAQQATFGLELLRHLGLVAVSVALATLCAIPLLLAAVYRPRGRAAIFTILNLLQTIPSIALFGLLIVPLSFIASHVALARDLGIGAIGPTPAIIALVLYSLLPLVRSADAGLRNVPADMRDCARGMGMTRREIFCKVDLPLAMPALISGLRVVTVQTIGLATVAALIGAGGLGTFVFQGIGEYALDLVLVGAFPTILLAVTADALFQILLANLRSRA